MIKTQSEASLRDQVNHIPVLLKEVIEYLDPKSGSNFIDCTLGYGGHTESILEKNGPQGRVLGIDFDAQAISQAKKRLNPAPREGLGKKYQDRLITVQSNYKNINKICYEHHFNSISGILLDLGVSSPQFEVQSRGFSFQTPQLDMRMSGHSTGFAEGGGVTATDIINKWPVEDLASLFEENGEEKLSKHIAQEIGLTRRNKAITSGSELEEIIKKVYQKYYHTKSLKNPATKIFQALRIEVNDELNNLKEGLPRALELLEKGGRLVVISYHSLEDRIVKNFFKNESKDCLCPPESPECQCDHKAQLKIITKKPVVPSDEEVKFNPRSRSAKMRVAHRI